MSKAKTVLAKLKPISSSSAVPPVPFAEPAPEIRENCVCSSARPAAPPALSATAKMSLSST